MLTPEVEWDQAFLVENPRARILLTIEDGVDTWKALSGSSNQISEQGSVLFVDSLSAEIDPATRDVQISETTIDVRDAWLRPILVAKRLRGKKVSLSIGTKEIAESKYLSYSSGLISKCTPDGNRDSGVIKISLNDMFASLADRELVGAWWQKHPLQIIYDGTSGILDRMGWGASLVDTATFNPDGGLYDTISHFVITRVGDFDAYLGNTGLKLVDGLCKLLGGQLVTDETGKLSFKRYDPSSAAVGDPWTDDDVIPGTWEQEPLGENVINHVVMRFGKGHESQTEELKLELNDATSQAALAYPGVASGVFTHELETDWCPKQGWGELGAYVPVSALPNAAATSLQVWGCPTGLCGIRGMFPTPAAQPALAKLSATRPAYLLLQQDFREGQAPKREIIKATAAIVPYSDWVEHHTVVDPQDLSSTDVGFFYNLSYPTIVRAQCGTTAQDFSADSGVIVWVTDITTLVFYGQGLLDRFGYGCPIVSFATRLNKFPHQRGDLISGTFSGGVAYGKDGFTSEKFEIIMKEPDPFGSPPCARWKIALAPSSSPPSMTGRGFGRQRAADSQELQDSMRDSDVSQPHVPSGILVAKTGDRTMSVSAGIVSAGAYRHKRRAATIDLDAFGIGSASKDVYIAIDPFSGALELAQVNNGAASPAKQDSSIWLAKAVLDGAAHISTVTDLRKTLAVPGDNLEAGSGPLTHLAQSTGALDNFTSVTARSLDDVTDGATYLKVTGVSAGHQIQEGSIASLAVTGGKIGALAVTEGKLGALAVTEGKIGALAVTEGKLGALAVTEGKIGALAVTEGKLGALAVTSGKVVAEAVTSAKIASAAVASVHVASCTVSTYDNTNANFVQRTRG